MVLRREIFLPLIILLHTIIPVSEGETTTKAMEIQYTERVRYQSRKELGKPVILGYYGRRFEPPIRIRKISRSEMDYSSPIKSLQSSYSAFWSKDLDWVIRGFRSFDRPEVTKSFKNKRIFERSTRVFASLVDVAVTDELQYGQLRILLVQHTYTDGKVSDFRNVMVRTNEGWLKTNELRRDAVWTYLIPSLPSLPMLEQVLKDDGAFNRFEYFPDKERVGKPIIVKARGKVFEPPLQIKFVDRKNARLSSPESTLEGVYSATKTGEVKWIASLINSSEANKIMKFVESHVTQIAWRAQLVKRAYIKKKILYGQYAIFLTENFGGEKRGDKKESRTGDWFILKETKDGWLLTNELQDDWVANFFVGGGSIHPKIGPAAPQ